MKYYIASCVFTSKFPELSFRIQDYIREKEDISIVRCCVPNYRIDDFTDMMPDNRRGDWEMLPDSEDFSKGDTVYSLCHNCSAIIDEWKTGVEALSLWELIDEDENFDFPEYKEMTMYVQDCWRANDRTKEQDAVRSLLKKMGITVLECEDSRDKTDFCGISLYRPAPPRNLKLAPGRFVERAEGKFQSLSESEQRKLMREYARRFHGTKVACYCHYCHEGLKAGGVDARHLAQLLFDE